MAMEKRSLLTSLTVVLVFGGGLVTRAGRIPPPSKKPAFEVLPAALVDRAEAIRERAPTESKAYDFLHDLTSEIGPRFSGSANDRRAVEWAQRKLKQLGFSNVRAEEVTVARWHRGEATGEIVSPVQRWVQPLALGGSVATPSGGIEAEVLEVAGLEELAKLERAAVAGKIVFLNHRMRRSRDGTGYREAAPNRRHGAARAAELGAAAALIRSVATSTTPEAHTGMTHYEEGVPRIPAAALSNPDADLLEEQFGGGKTVRFRIELTCRDLPNGTSANVIGEIPGQERPEEIVLLAAHLDSWDVGTGTLDDGIGCAIITDVARLIGELKPPPRRTIRVFLAANEEFGLAGALTYAKKYASDVKLHVAAMEADFGAGRVWGMRSRVADEALPAVRDLGRLLAPLGIEYLGNYASGGADLLPLLRYRIPLFEFPQDATKYFDAYHSANDTLDKVDRDDLSQIVAAYAVVTLVAAEFEDGFGRAPKFNGQWPYPFDRLFEGKDLPR